MSFGSKNSWKAKKGQKGLERLLKANKGQNERKCDFSYLSKVKTLFYWLYSLWFWSKSREKIKLNDKKNQRLFHAKETPPASITGTATPAYKTYYESFLAYRY